MKLTNRSFFKVALFALLQGCAAQATWAPHMREPMVAAFDVGGRIVGARASGAYGSGDLVLAEPRDGAFSLRHALVGGGYRLHRLGFDRLSLELGADLGIGEPAHVSWEGTGLYVGASSALLYRISGNQDAKVGYSPVGLLWDLVAQIRGGVWNPPAGNTDSELLDASLELGIRFTAISDLPVASNRNWQP